MSAPRSAGRGRREFQCGELITAKSAQRGHCSEFTKVGRCGTSLAMRVRARVGACRCRTGCGPMRHAMESPQPWLWMWILGAPLVYCTFDWLRTPKTSIRSDSYRSDDRTRVIDRPMASSSAAR